MTKTTQRIEQPHRFKGILSRLRKDTSGVALYMYAIGLVPIMASAGIGFDIGRAYLVRSKLQQACDAGAIAGRRSMNGITLEQKDKNEAERFFRANFKDGMLGSEPIGGVNSPATTRSRITAELDDNEQLFMTARTSVPTSLVSQFVGNNEVEVSVRCLGEEFFVNTDIMLVLDTTGSMNCAIGAAQNCGPDFEGGSSSATAVSSSKMGQMRSAIKTLYNDLLPIKTKLEQENLRMRIGWVPYSTNVQVGHLIAQENPNYIRPAYIYTFPDYTTSSDTDTYKFLPSDKDDLISGTSSKWNGCIEERKTEQTTYSQGSIPSDAWDMDIAKIPSDTSSTRSDVADSRWALMPKMNKYWTRTWTQREWVKVGRDRRGNDVFGWRDITYSENSEAVCAHKSIALQEWPSQSEFNNEIDKIVTGDGGTHHDIGMIWGTRMLSNQGIFGSDNPNSHNGVEVNRTMIFMTDGYSAYGSNSYSAYGVMQKTKRSAESDWKNAHEKRFQLACTAAKSQNIDIWVVAMLPKTSPASDPDKTSWKNTTDALKQCASRNNQVVFVENTSELTNAFKAVSDKIGNLRVGQ
jgi:Flp pilus assembly protein TadG